MSLPFPPVSPGLRRPPVLLLLAALSHAGCGPAPAPATTKPPATVTHAVKEADLASLTLTPEAERRVGIVVDTAAQRDLPRARTVGGEVQVRPGSRAVLVAPRAGTVLAPVGAGLPAVGRAVAAGTPLIRLTLLPAEGDLFQAGDEVASADARLANARLRAARAETLLVRGAGTVEAAEDARQALVEAEAAFRVALSRQAVLSGAADSAGGRSVTLEAPFDGVVQALDVAPGQRVASGAALLEVAALDPLWVRVPLFPGDLREVDATRNAVVTRAGGQGGGWPARPVRGPASADPVAASVDLYFEVPNPGGVLRPGERVAVTLPLSGRGDRGVVVPWSAIVRDIGGGAWVYVRLGEGRYGRRRVEVDHVVGDAALLARGLAPGELVVTVGAAELFSTEFGTGK